MIQYCTVELSEVLVVPGAVSATITNDVPAVIVDTLIPLVSVAPDRVPPDRYCTQIRLLAVTDELDTVTVPEERVAVFAALLEPVVTFTLPPIVVVALEFRLPLRVTVLVTDNWAGIVTVPTDDTVSTVAYEPPFKDACNCQLPATVVLDTGTTCALKSIDCDAVDVVFHAAPCQ